MRMLLCWTMLAFCIVQSSAIQQPKSELNKVKTFASTQKIKSETILWGPYSKLNSYQSFEDVKMYMLHVPIFANEMELTFQYYGRFSESHKTCNNTITVLLQQGSPAVPYREDLRNETWLYNNSNTFKTVVSLGNPKQKIIKSPLPGYWFVTSFLPSVKKVKKIKEQGLSKPDENCLSALVIIQNVSWPGQAAEVIGKDETIQRKIGDNGQYDAKIYQYFIPDHSKMLIIRLKYHCVNPTENCSLGVSVSGKSLPSSTSRECPPNQDCLLQIAWPQLSTSYYIEVRGINTSYEINVNHTDCEYDDLSCYPFIELNLVKRVHLENTWEEAFFNNSWSAFSLNIEPNYVGTTLVVQVKNWILNDDKTTLQMCIHRDFPILVVEESLLSSQYCISSIDNISMKVLFPQPGKWFITVRIHSSKKHYNPIVRLTAQTQTCLDSQCSGHGHCQIAHDVSISYGVCKCHYGYSGWTCADYFGIDILAICLLTISNIAFVPGIILAVKRKFYPEAIVYLFTMYCSTVYHACDSHGYCIYEYNTLQLSDFFASILSVWYTLTLMIKLSLFWHRTFNIFALLCIFLGIQLSRFGVLMIAVPGGVGIAIVLLSFGVRSYYRRKCFPSCRRWLLFILPAAVLAVVAIVVYSLLETTANYKYLHSLWHICIALSVPLLLPSVRQQKLFVEYNMIESLGGEEHFRDSRESLLLNPWETKESENNQSDEDLLPKLIV